MGSVLITKTSFVSGELDPALLGRLDLKAQGDGAARLRNVLVQPTGGVTRRPGLARVASLPGALRLLSFEAAFGPALVAIGPERIDVVRDGKVLAGPQSLWSAAQLGNLAWARLGNQLLLTHPEVSPQILAETTEGEFTLQGWTYETGTDSHGTAHTYQPYARFAAADVALELHDPVHDSPDVALSPGPVILLASEPVFDPSHIGSIVRYQGHEVRIASVLADQTRATGLLREKLPNGKATLDWDEQAFSTLRGWPATVTVYQSRLVIGGSGTLPDWIWFSKIGAYFNFDLGAGLDDESIAFRLGSGYGTDELHTVRALQPTQPLQVFTTAGEWVVRGVPLTPKSVQLELQTRVGSWTGRRLQPVDVDGATLFLGASGRELREFLYVLSEQAYQSADIALLARHLLVEPADMGFAGRRRLLLILRGDGKAAAVTIDRNVNVVAWSLLETTGSLAALTVHEGELWFLVAAGGDVFLERLDDSLGVDHARTLASPAATAVWTGLDEYEGQAVVATTAEGDLVRATVVSGALTLPRPTTGLTVGLPFTVTVEPMPVAVPSAAGVSPDHAYRPVRVSFRVLETAALSADLGDGPRPVLPTPANANTPGFTGDVALRAMGWRRGMGRPPWRVVQDDPLPATILSVTTEIKVND